MKPTTKNNKKKIPLNSLFHLKKAGELKRRAKKVKGGEY